MKIIKAPEPIIYSSKVLFLAGSIEMGAAVNWQKTVEDWLINTDWTILNPRRDDWDNAWIQDKNNKQFREQVEWELSGLSIAHKIIMCFDPITKSPISLLELGLFGWVPNKMIVVCPEGFWRKGNVDIVCEKYNIQQTQTLEDALTYL